MRNTFFFWIVFTVCASSLYASVSVETEGMEGVLRGDGTFLVGSPTYIFDRPLGSIGIHAESELWSPKKMRQRLLLNRFSLTPSWDLLPSGMWIKTGNEIGDMIYQDFLTEDNEVNRTPLLEGGFRSKSYRGFFATARLFQVDHYSSSTLKTRKAFVGGTDYAFFGENLPFFSTAYGGIGYSEGRLTTSVLAGQEYLWIFGESGRWIPVKYSPRIEGRIDYGALQGTLVYERGEFQNSSKGERGLRNSVNGSFYYACDNGCNKSMLQAGAGAQFRAVSDSGNVYFGIEDDVIIFPFLEVRFLPHKKISFALNAGANDKDFLVQDSLEFKVTPNYSTDVLFGIKNRVGTTLNPLGDTYEYFDLDTLDLKPSGIFQIYSAYLDINKELNVFSYGGRVTGWLEKGAETFDTTETLGNATNPLRYGNVSRINSFIKGVSAEVRMNFKYERLFELEALSGIERIAGDKSRFEVSPAEGFVYLKAFWNFSDYLRISQSLNYRSNAKWNLRYSDPLMVKGAWYWNITVEENFPNLGLLLSGTLLHIIGNNALQVPGGGVDRTRFFCEIKKAF